MSSGAENQSSNTSVFADGASVNRLYQAFDRRENSERVTNVINAQVWVTDLSGQIIRANDPWLKARGFESIKEAVGKTAHDVFDAVVAGASVNEDIHVIDTGRESVSAFTDESGRSFQSVRMPLLEQGDMIGLIGVITPQEITVDSGVTPIAQADVDQLTGASSLAALHTYLTEVLAAGEPMSMLLLDLDDFHVVNNSMGRDVGDQLLQKAAKRLINVFGSRLFRIGGDKFVILLPTNERAQLDVVTEQILQRWRQPLVVDGIEIYGGVSIGIAPIADQENSEEVLQDAEMAIREAKDGGRNRAVVFSREQRKLADDELWRQMLVRRAVASKEFSLHWQPIVEIESGNIAGVEAFLRWQPAGGAATHPAAEFIPFLEHSGLVIPVGRQVLDDACRQHTLWRSRSEIDRPIPIFINLSRRQFSSDSLVDDVLTTLQQHAVDPKHLTLEIADFTPGDDLHKLISDIDRLQRAGVRVAIDEFGAGSSTLEGLANLPIQVVKIARSITDRIAQGKDEPLLDAIQHMARAIGHVPIVQGVENDMQLDWLRAKGWTHAQGYHLSKPLDPEAMTSLLIDHFSRPEGQRWGN